MAVRYYRLAVLLATTAAFLASCGGGSGVGNTRTVPTPAPTFGPTASVIIAAGGTNASLAGGGTTSTAFAFPAASAGVGGTLSLAASTSAPNGTVPFATRRAAQSNVTTVLQYVLVESSVAATFAGTPALTFVLPAEDVVAGGTYQLSLYQSTDSSAGYVTLSTGTLTGSTVTFAAGTTAFSIPATPGFVVFALTLTVPGPSPSPSASASATPSGSPTPTPTPGSNTVTASAPYLTFASPTAPPQAYTITETTSAALTESDTCTTGLVTIVTVASGPEMQGQNSFQVTVTPHAVGTCAITYQDGGGNAATVGVTVSLPAPIVIQ